MYFNIHTKGEGRGVYPNECILCRIKFLFLKKSYISPKLIEWNMVDNYVTNIKGNI